MNALTRRSMARLGALTVIGSLVALMTALPGARAQDASPADSAAVPPLLVAWAAAWESGDSSQLAALYTRDAIYEEIPTGSRVRGHDAIVTLSEETHASFADIRVTPVRGFQDADHAVLEGLFAGSAGGNAFEVPFVVIMDLEGELIVHSRDYFDLYSVLVQIGALPAPGTPEAATPST